MSHTIEQQRQRVEQEITKMFDDLDKTYLRKMQVCCFYYEHLQRTFAAITSEVMLCQY